MALLDKHSTCWFCTRPIDFNGNFLVAEFDFCQSQAHWDCYAAWPGQPEFARSRFTEAVAGEGSSRILHKVYLDGFLFIEVKSWNLLGDSMKKRLANEGRVHLWLVKTGIPLSVKLNHWTSWLEKFDGAIEKFHPIQRRALQDVLPILRTKFPTPESILNSVDWESKERTLAELEVSARAEAEDAQRATRENNQRCGELSESLREEGLRCPHCHETSKNIRFYDNNPDRRSYFVCQLCAWAFDANDFDEQWSKE